MKSDAMSNEHSNSRHPKNKLMLPCMSTPTKDDKSRSHEQLNPLKRKRRNLSGPNDRLYKFFEALDARVAWLEHPQGGVGSEASDLESLARALAVRVSRLEEGSNISYNIQTNKPGLCPCPISKCGREYKEPADLNAHIRKQHKALAPLVNQTRCYRCDKDLKTTHGLVVHEKRIHEEKYKSRAEGFADGFKQSRCKSPLSQSVFEY